AKSTESTPPPWDIDCDNPDKNVMVERRLGESNEDVARLATRHPHGPWRRQDDRTRRRARTKSARNMRRWRPRRGPEGRRKAPGVLLSAGPSTNYDTRFDLDR